MFTCFSRQQKIPSTTKNQSVPTYTDPVPSCINHYDHISTSAAPYLPSTTKYQSVLTYTGPVPSYNNQYRFLLTQYHQHQPLPSSTDLVPSYINQSRSILTQYHQVSTSTNLYCCCLAITDFCTVYPGSCFCSPHSHLHTAWLSLPPRPMLFNVDPEVLKNIFYLYMIDSVFVC